MTTDSPGQEVSPVPPSTDEDDEGDQDVLEFGRFIILSQTIAGMERHISNLYKIRDEANFLDSSVTVGVTPTLKWSWTPIPDRGRALGRSSEKDQRETVTASSFTPPLN
ncbi:unnamed protein product [Pleuronectes platessa]|uniref:Uncharacterized protein n=1 Tax=Pleuronectes platessa TaxID=8262 RepID=A0A9N7UMF9_PLEPL|nr:unnamed protein product [Pleuronectes platessa]